VIVAGIGCRRGATPEAAARLGLPLLFVDDAALRAAQPHCVTRSAAAERATGFASVAEAAAIGMGGVLLLPRLAGAGVTCAVARR
jgi:cobalamin biosynthesis protein CbiG